MKLRLAGTFATDVLILLLGFVSGILAARFLQPDGRGALAVILFWPQLLAGIGLLSVGEAATYRIGSRPDQSALITASCVWFALSLSALAMVLGYAVLPLLLGEDHAHLLSLSRMYLLYIPFNFLTLTLLATDQGELRYARFNLVRLLAPVSYLIFIVSLWATDTVSVELFVAANFAATVAVACVRLWLYGTAFKGRPSFAETGTLLRLALRFHPATVLLLLASQADIYVVLMLWDDAVTGHYVIALTLATSALNLVSGVYQKVLFPHMAAAQTQCAQLELFSRGIRHATLLLAVVSLLLAAATPWLVPLLFGWAFRDAVGATLALLPAYALVGLKLVIIQGLRGLGEAKFGWVSAAIGLFVFLLVAWPCGRILGLVGIAAAVALSNFVALAFLWHVLRKRFGLDPRDYWGLNRRTFLEIKHAVENLKLQAGKTGQPSFPPHL